jgi:hypothetical protein
MIRETCFSDELDFIERMRCIMHRKTKKSLENDEKSQSRKKRENLYDLPRS